ncbi:MAG: hypothetical protein KDD29_09760 [Flavobacteriales bacterium]|nr:hypothetical protein [Flavobacteriales bacterium]MCB9335138.1 hypothetical protein [Flavobacteriales bacterium]
MKNEISFPVFRKYKNQKSFFKIISQTEFEEIKLFGAKGELHSFSAKILPDRNYIYDMLYNYTDYWDESDENEFNLIKSKFVIQ